MSIGLLGLLDDIAAKRAGGNRLSRPATRAAPATPQYRRLPERRARTRLRL
jgi:hypothetical protein